VRNQKPTASDIIQVLSSAVAVLALDLVQQAMLVHLDEWPDRTQAYRGKKAARWQRGAPVIMFWY